VDIKNYALKVVSCGIFILEVCVKHCVKITDLCSSTHMQGGHGRASARTRNHISSSNEYPNT